MGELEQKKIRKINQDTFNVRQELNEVKVWNNLPETGMGENLQKEKLSYLDNMIINSQDENIRLLNVTERKLQDVNKKNFNPYRPPSEFKQKVPAAAKDKRWATIEKNKIEEARNTYDSADLCTVRELESMNGYVASGGHKNITPTDALPGSELKASVDHILGMKIDLLTITDDYISNHASEMYEYVQKLKELNRYVKNQPTLFDSLREEQLVELKCRIKTGKNLEKFLVSHMKLHGVELSIDARTRKPGVSLRPEKNDKKLDIKGKAAKKKLKDDLLNGNKSDRDALINDLKGLAKEKAKLYTENRKLSSKDELDRLDQLLVSNAALYKSHSAEIKKAYGEIKRLLSLRDEEIEKQKENLKKGDVPKAKGELSELEKCNARLDFMSASLSSYKEFLYSITRSSQTGEVSQETARFLKSQGEKGMLELLRNMASGINVKQPVEKEKKKSIAAPKKEEKKVIGASKKEKKKPVAAPKNEEKKIIEASKKEKKKPVAAPKNEEKKIIEAPKKDKKKSIAAPKKEEKKSVAAPGKEVKKAEKTGEIKKTVEKTTGQDKTINDLIGAEVQSSINKDRQRTREMKAIALNIEAIQAFLRGNMPPIGAKGAEQELDGAVLIANSFYNRLSRSIEECLEDGGNYGGNASLKKMLESLKIRCTEESNAFRQAVVGYREAIEGGAMDGKKEMTWAASLKYMRSMFYDLDSAERDGTKSIETKTGGSGTSSIIFMKYAKGSNAVKTTSEKLMSNLHGKDKSRKKERNVIFKPESVIESLDKLEETSTRNVKEFDFNLHGAISKKDAERLRGELIKAVVGDIKALGKEKASEMLLHYAASDGAQMFQDDMRASEEERKKNTPEIDITQWKQLKKVYEDKKNIRLQDHIAEVFLSLARMELQRGIAEENAKIKSGSPVSVRNVATSRLATVLGLQDMICDSRNAYIRKEGKMQGGIVMEHSGGKDLFQIYEEAQETKSKVFYSDNAIGDLFKLQIFDALCGQIDRNDGNFHFSYKLDKRKNAFVADKIKAIDSDMAFGMVGMDELKEGLNRLIPVDKYSIMGMPLDMLNNIMSLQKEFVSDVLGDLLTEEEVLMVWVRLDYIRATVGRLVKKGELKQDKRTGKYSYTKADYKDDKLRQLLVLKKYEMLAEDYKKALEEKGYHDEASRTSLRDFSYFLGVPFETEGGIDHLILRRRNEIATGRK